MKTYKVTYIKTIGELSLCEKLVSCYGDIKNALESINNTGNLVSFSEILKIELVPFVK